MKQKGIFYSVIAMLFIAPLVLLVTSDLNTKQDVKTKIIGDRLIAYSASIDEDLPRALAIMAKRALTEAIIYMDTNGTAFGDSAAVLKELMINGTLGGNASNANFTVSLWASILQQKGQLYGFNSDIKVLNLSFSSIDSYTVGVTINISVNATNPGASMELYRISRSTIPVSIEGLDDPIYTLKTNGILKRPVKRPNITVSGEPAFDAAVSNGFYMPSPEGAGFLDRMEGRLRPSGKYGASQGLESVVYIPFLQANGITIKPTQTNIDYLYFDPAAYPGSPVNQSSFSWLKIDAAHAGTYNISLMP